MRAIREWDTDSMKLDADDTDFISPDFSVRQKTTANIVKINTITLFC